MRTVLLADDDKSILDRLQTEISWQAMGYDSVLCVQDGLSAYELLKSNHVDLVISDIVMPGMNGLELLKRINEGSTGKVCFIILSAHKNFNYAQQALRYNCREYIIKPVDPGYITETVIRLEREGYIGSVTEQDAVLTVTREDITSGRVYTKDQPEGDETGKVLYKKELDRLISAIDINDEHEIISCVDELCNNMSVMHSDRSIALLNLNYLKVRLIHLPENTEASEESWEGFDTLSDIVLKGNPARERGELEHLALLYARRLSGMRRNTSQGVLNEIENEIREHYMDNLTLKDLADKYYVNSSHLGRLFKKQYNCSFKEYLCAVRIEEAAALLSTSADDVSMIAEKVGYNNIGYFTHKFIEIKGCSPAKYRAEAYK